MQRMFQFAALAALAVALGVWLTPAARPARANDAVTVVIPATSDGGVFGSAFSYPLARANYSGCNDGAATVGQSLLGQLRTVYRGGLHFDLSAIPAGATPMYARLTVEVVADASGQDFTGELYRIGAGAAVCGNGAAWYGGAGTLEGTLFNTAGGLGGSQVMLTDPAGLTPGGGVAYLVRSSRDVAGIPPTGRETVTLGTAEAGGVASLLVVYIP